MGLSIVYWIQGSLVDKGIRTTAGLLQLFIMVIFGKARDFVFFRQRLRNTVLNSIYSYA